MNKYLFSIWKFVLMPQAKQDIQYMDVPEILTYDITLRTGPLCQMSPKWVKKCGNYGEKINLGSYFLRHV
jgi:hypothetical protein